MEQGDAGNPGCARQSGKPMANRVPRTVVSPAGSWLEARLERR
jgi:hypothetical protein